MNPNAVPLKRALRFSAAFYRPSAPLIHQRSDCRSAAFPAASSTVTWSKGSRFLVARCISAKTSDSFEPDRTKEDAFVPAQEVERKDVDGLKILRGANSIIPHVVLASTVLALVCPPSFTWFTNRYYAPALGFLMFAVGVNSSPKQHRMIISKLFDCVMYYAPALGFLMFAVGVNSSPKDFIEAIKRPEAIAVGYVGQFIIKPLLGYVVGTISVSTFNLPTSLGAGIMLVSCVSGAQLSNYATFLTDPPMAPLSIVMTSLSTATAVFVTPMLSLLLIGKKLPVDVKGMMSSIMQIVVAPIAAGLLLNRFFPRFCSAIQPFLPPLSVFVTALCVGSPLAINIGAILSPFGIAIVLLIFGFHAASFMSGYSLTGVVFQKSADVKALQRTISFETGMQSSLLALALANKFFQDPLVGVPAAISVVLMSLMGFALVMVWSKRKQQMHFDGISIRT